MDSVIVVTKGGSGSGFKGHAGRPGKIGGSAPKIGQSPHIFVGVSSSPYLPGRRIIELPSNLRNQPSGAPIRGEAVMELIDPRIPETVYHMTTNLPAVKQAGELSARGAGGLGGDKTDQIVSMSISKDITEQLAADTKFVAKLCRKFHPSEPGDYKSAEHAAWGEKVVDEMEKQAQKEGFSFKSNLHPELQIHQYSVKDFITHYFTQRESKLKKRNPLFFSSADELARIDPKKVGVVKIPKWNLDTGALLVNFDLSNSYGLQEIRLYGDVPLTGATFEKKEEPIIVTKGGKGSGFRGHTGRPGKVGGSQAEGTTAINAWRGKKYSGMTNEEANLVRGFEENNLPKRGGKILDREYSMIVRDDRVLCSVKGGKSQCTIPKGDYKDAVSIHNHPIMMDDEDNSPVLADDAMSMPLSGSDIAFAMKNDLKEMRVIGYDDKKHPIIFRAIRPKGGWNVKKMYDDVAHAFYSQWTHLISDRRMFEYLMTTGKYPRAASLFQHGILQRLAIDFGFKYVMEEWK